MPAGLGEQTANVERDTPRKCVLNNYSIKHLPFRPLFVIRVHFGLGAKSEDSSPLRDQKPVVYLHGRRKGLDLSAWMFAWP